MSHSENHLSWLIVEDGGVQSLFTIHTDHSSLYLQAMRWRIVRQRKEKLGIIVNNVESSPSNPTRTDTLIAVDSGELF